MELHDQATPAVIVAVIVRSLLTLDDWDVIAVRRRKPDVEGRYAHVAVDLLDRAQIFEALKRPRGVTHGFFSAYIERPTWADMVAQPDDARQFDGCNRNGVA